MQHLYMTVWADKSKAHVIMTVTLCKLQTTENQVTKDLQQILPWSLCGLCDLLQAVFCEPWPNSVTTLLTSPLTSLRKGTLCGMHKCSFIRYPRTLQSSQMHTKGCSISFVIIPTMMPWEIWSGEIFSRLCQPGSGSKWLSWTGEVVNLKGISWLDHSGKQLQMTTKGNRTVQCKMFCNVF